MCMNISEWIYRNIHMINAPYYHEIIIIRKGVAVCRNIIGHMLGSKINITYIKRSSKACGVTMPYALARPF